jgi:hypothetical protein
MGREASGSMEIDRPEREADHSPPTIVEIEWNFAFIFPYVFTAKAKARKKIYLYILPVILNYSTK